MQRDEISLQVLTYIDQCYYHPAPLTAPKGPGMRTRTASRRGPARPAFPSHQQYGRHMSSPMTITSANSASTDTQFLGSTSYLSVFKEAPLEISKASNRSLYTEFEKWRTEPAYASARLVRLISALPFYREQLSWYYRQGRFTIIPAPIVLDSLSRAQDYLDQNPDDGPGSWTSRYDEIVASTKVPLRVSPGMSADEFYSLFTGPRLRFEFVGFILGLSGMSVQGRYPGDHVLDLGNGERMDVETFTKEMMLASSACVEKCQQYGHVSDLTIWMQYMQIVLGTEVLGETSSFPLVIA